MKFLSLEVLAPLPRESLARFTSVFLSRSRQIQIHRHRPTHRHQHPNPNPHHIVPPALRLGHRLEFLDRPLDSPPPLADRYHRLTDGRLLLHSLHRSRFDHRSSSPRVLRRRLPLLLAALLPAFLWNCGNNPRLRQRPPMKGKRRIQALLQQRYVSSHRGHRFRFGNSNAKKLASRLLRRVFGENLICRAKHSRRIITLSVLVIEGIR